MFKDALCVNAVGNNKWQLVNPLRYLNSMELVTVPAGFVTDLASIPRFLQWLPHFGVNGRSRRPAVMHDWLYACIRNGDDITKRDADSIFREALRAEGLDRFTCGMYYYAVKWFGRSSL